MAHHASRGYYRPQKNFTRGPRQRHVITALNLIYHWFSVLQPQLDARYPHATVNNQLKRQKATIAWWTSVEWKIVRHLIRKCVLFSFVRSTTQKLRPCFQKKKEGGALSPSSNSQYGWMTERWHCSRKSTDVEKRAILNSILSIVLCHDNSSEYKEGAFIKTRSQCQSFVEKPFDKDLMQIEWRNSRWVS